MTRALIAFLALGASLAQGQPTDEERQAVARALDESFPDRPEWVDMFTDILQGSQLGPGEGWFKKAVAQSRLDWKATAKQYDKDGDGKVAREEFPGGDSDFSRLDRDKDKSLAEADFDFSAHALAPSNGSMMFTMFDKDGNGKVTREEVDAIFEGANGEKGGGEFFSLSDFQEAFKAPTPARNATSRNPNAKPAPATGGPSKEVLIRGLFRQEIGSLQAGPAVGESAPDFTLKSVDGKEDVTLAKLVGTRPVVLVFGNFTCGPFRNQSGNVEKLFQRNKDRANFAMVYVREAHPIDGWRMESNDRVEVTLPQPKTYEERVAVAGACKERLKFGFPVLVDGIEDPVGGPYSGMPSRLYLIDREGKVAYKSGRGPFGFKPAELEHALLLLLQEEGAKANAAGAASAP